MATNVFYAWQSDHDEKVCHYFIRDCVRDAIRRLKEEAVASADTDVEEADAPTGEPRVPADVELDHDTKGVPGTPHIADTIKEKIAACAVFLADVTHVAPYVTDDGRGKQAQNGNVLIELGMALVNRPASRILLVMNTAFGDWSALPFDLRHHRRPICYTLSDASNKERVKQVRAELTGQLRDALRMMLADVTRKEAAEGAQRDAAAQKQREAERVAQVQRVDEVWKGFEERVRAGQFHTFDPSASYLTFSLIPLVTPANIEVAKIGDICNRLPMMQPPNDFTTRPDHVRVFRAPRPYDSQPGQPQRAEAVAALHRDGRILVAQLIPRPPSELVPENFVNYVACERKLIEHTAQYVKLLRGLGATGPLRSRFAIHRVNGCSLVYGHRASDLEMVDQPDITPPAVEITDEIDGTDPQAIASALRNAFDWVWQSIGADGCPYFNQNGSFDFNAR